MTEPGFHYRNGHLCVDGVRLSAISGEFGTPLYVYSAGLLEANFRRIADSFSRMQNTMIAYSVKSNSNLAVLRLLADLGAGFDIVSGGELERVKRVGVPGERIIFAGVGKTVSEMHEALKHGVAQFNLESISEAERLNHVAAAMGRKAPVAIRINPDVDAKTHKKINTGPKESKFGIPFDQAFDLAKRIGGELANLELAGLHCHIGSQILDNTRHAEAVSVVVGVARQIMEKSGSKLKTLNFGGGFGIAYQPDQKAMTFQVFAEALAKELDKLGVTLILEPGRSISAPAGVLLTKVEYIKKGENKTFVIIDGSMTELMRPTLYDAHHEILPLVESNGSPKAVADVVGPVCETGDYLALGRSMVIPNEGDLLAVMDAGAYAFVMASNYNTRGKPAEVLVKEGKAHLVRARETIEDTMRGEKTL